MPQRPRILLADDNDTDIELWKHHLPSLDCEIEVATDGLDTLKRIQQFRPDLILLNPTMPKMSGFEICRWVKSNPVTSRTMIIMVTGLNALDDIERAVDAGTDDFLSKPINEIELVKRVEIMLKLRRGL
jgi:two-component system, OmpR family, alkaline phosphatase synthesis response regulator PhoP